MAKEDIYDIVDLKMVAYGNTNESDGTYSCQHGAGECQSDALELCVQYKLSGDINSIQSGDTTKQALPFILCMEEASGDPTKSASCYSQSMTNSTLAYTTVTDCAAKEFDTVQAAGAKATAPTNHQYVPWVLVDGELLSNTDALLKSICDAYTGPAPKSCKRMMGIDQKRCYK